jgi:hypothetical protein
MRHLRHLFVFAVLGAIAATPACSCDNPGRHGNGGDMGTPAIGSITIDPSDVTLDLTNGGAPPSQAFTVTLHAMDGDHDVTGMCTYVLADQTLGVMNLNIFTAGTAHGGSTTLVANLNNQTAQANIHVRVNGSFTTPDCMSGCSFPMTGAPACNGVSASPTVVYPPDGVLMPPNLNVITLQWQPGMGNTMFEVDLTNPATNVTILTKCTKAVDSRLNDSGGCRLDLTQQMWDFVAKSNKGGDPIKITVRGTDGTCVAPGANSVNMSIAEQDVSGGIYYWQSTITASGTGGAIYRKEFGDTTPEENLTPMSGTGFSATCYGCHALSRDGLRMTVNTDDSDSDDEYSDVSSGLVDVSTKTFMTEIGYADGQAAGYQTFNHDHSLYLGTSGDGSGNPSSTTTGAGAGNVFFLWNGNPTMPGLTPLATITAGPAGSRPTQPDWAPDDSNVVYVMGTKTGGGSYQDDTHVFGGSLWTLPYTGSNKFGAPVELLKSNGENNYYPSYSPDGKFVVFNRVPLSGSTGAIDTCASPPAGGGGGDCLNDSFSNPKARVFLLPNGAGAMPIDLELANGSPAGMPVDVSNSWPRWTPFLQKYKGSDLLWVTFSSTRDYGLLVRNHVPVAGTNQVQCYPPDEVHDPGGSHGQQFPGNCQQPQIWMAAINLSSAEVSSPGDPSFPAFWLSFQNITTHNHSAQWTSSVVTTPPPDGGACIAGGQDCTHNPNGCCADAPICTANGTCGNL